MVILERSDFSKLFKLLKEQGYQIIGPTVQNEAIVYDELDSPEDLPVGVLDEQSGGHYSLKQTRESHLFSYVVGPTSWKRFLHLAELTLWTAKKDGDKLHIQAENSKAPRYAFLGVRACELAAIDIQDRVFLQGEYIDPHYQKRRSNIFTIAVNCTRPGGACFCSSMNTGPKAKQGFDLSLTEVYRKSQHYFVLESGSKKGEALLAALNAPAAEETQIAEADRALEKSAEKMGKEMPVEGLKEVLERHFEHPYWEEIAKRCLNCANCTMVCPTCFCTTVEDVTDLTGDVASRVRRWDSCFTVDFSYIHGGSIRASGMSRYRQWMTHKLARWQDQFDVNGCVGCGRCITWCPVGIDITEEAAAFRKIDKKARKRQKKLAS